jgi:hypothetical protein
MRYVMVTNWKNHWGNLGDNPTLFTFGMIKWDFRRTKPKENTQTIFIKKNEDTKEVEKAWIGEVYDAYESTYKNKECFRFKVRIKNEISCPSKYTKYSEGWYVDEEEERFDVTPQESSFDSTFFSELKSTDKWPRFEELVYYLIRCIGMHISHKFGPKKQRGKPDGFFKFGNFAVLYDCTLERDFEENKRVQMENFCGQMKKGFVEYGDKKITIEDCRKSVWIITRGGSQRLIKQIDGIKIREIPVEKIIELYRKRIREDFDETALEEELQNL